MNVLRENRAFDERREYFGEKKVGDCAELISRSGMARDIDAERTKLLNQAPDLGAAGPDFGRDLGAADDNCSVVDQKLHDAAETGIRGGMGRGTAGFRISRDAEL